MSTAIQDISAADVQLADLLKHIEAGNEVLLTRNGNRVARVIPEIAATSTKEERRALLEQFQRRVTKKILPGPDAARSQDFLYDEDGLPG